MIPSASHRAPLRQRTGQMHLPQHLASRPLASCLAPKDGTDAPGPVPRASRCATIHPLLSVVGDFELRTGVELRVNEPLLWCSK